MSNDIIRQLEINETENKFYPFRQRPYCPNYLVRPLTGKFYARQDCPDPSTLDEAIEKEIQKRQNTMLKDKYKEPVTTNMEYGWYVPEVMPESYSRFHHPKCSNWITRIGALIALEDQKNPMSPFKGVAFVV